MHTYRFRQGRVPYCHVQSWLSPRGGRERGQGAYHTGTRAKRRQWGAPLGHLPTCWVILLLSGERRHFRQRAWVGAAPQLAGDRGPVASGCWGAASGFLFRGADYIESRPFSVLRVEPGCRLPTSSQPIPPTSSDRR